MDPAVQAFKDKWAEKSAAKQESLVATGYAKLAEHNADVALEDTDRARYLAEADQHWAVVATRGHAGAEGKLEAEAFAMAEEYVDAHPEQFASFERYVNPDDHDLLVTLITALSKNGREEEALKLTMFELARFERQHFGQRLQAVAKVRR
jgi:hypothetical protein